MIQKQTNIQTQQQKQLQQQRLSPMQVKYMRLLEMPLAQLEDNVNQELSSNPSLEHDYNADEYAADSISMTDSNGINGTVSDDGSSQARDGGDDITDTTAQQAEAEHMDETERRDDAMSTALDLIGQDDRMDGTGGMTLSDDYGSNGIDYVTGSQKSYQDSNSTMPEAQNVTSFIDTLTEQMQTEELSEQERQIMMYIICSLDSDGLLRLDTQTITDELAIYENLYVTDDEVEDVIHKLQEFNPPGIGARSLQECLTIQVERMKATPMTMLMYKVVTDLYDDFISNRWSRIESRLNISEQQAQELKQEIRHRLNPKPGFTLGEVQNQPSNQITPDIILYTDEDGNISFELNHGNMPRLCVSKTDEDMLQAMEQAKKDTDIEALAFTQKYVTKAREYIEAMRMRNETITIMMTAIIRMQRQFFLTGDENDLKPMILKDLENATGLDKSTISRATRAKYVQTPWGTFQLRKFFSAARSIGNETNVSYHEIINVLRDIIEHEDRRKPYSDSKLESLMKEKGYPIARRTVAKYREQLNIPNAQHRRQ